MKVMLRRWLPGLCAVALLALALVVPSRGVRARTGPALAAIPCDQLLQQGGDNAIRTFVTNQALYQPFPTGANAVAGSVTFNRAPYSSGRMEVRVWDAELLKPRPGVVALRSVSFSASYLQVHEDLEMTFDPPIVTQEQAGIAESMGSHLVLKYSNLGFGDQNVHYDTDGPAGIPEALLLSGGVNQSLAGNHPVLTHRLCGGDAALQSLDVVQSVITADANLGDIHTYEIIQRFRVPVATEVRWVEFPASGNGNPCLLSIVDGAAPTAPYYFGPALGSASFTAGSETWRRTIDFESPFTLEAEHDYWLVFRLDGNATLRGRIINGSEGPEFARIRDAYMRYEYGYSWGQLNQRAVNFRIVGTPVQTTAVGPAARARAAFGLAVAPNPARGAAALAWTGAQGGVRFEVLDARGRRVAQGMSAQGETGRWAWNTAGDDGRALPAGLYFVRARDEAGRSTSARVTVVR